MKILIIDGYKKANFLIHQLTEDNHQVTFLHEDHTFAEKILNKYEIETYIGNASTPKVLKSLENLNFDLLISLSNSDNKNFVVCTLAKKLLNIGRTITLVSNPNNQKVFKELGIEVTVSASHLITNIIQRVALVKDSLNFISLEEHEVHPYEISIEKNFSSSGKKIKDINFPKSCVVCCIIRNKKSIIPTGETTIETFDLIIIFTNIKNNDEIRKVFL